MKPLIAIVGRPNVGKSMLFNKLVGQRLSIVEDTPGVTRDRLYAEAEWRNRKFDLVDTGGSLCNAAKALVEVGGAKSVQACASHGVLSGPAIDRINDSVITELALLDTIPAIDPKKSSKIKYLPVAPMFAEAIERIYQEVSISKLFR